MSGTTESRPGPPPASDLGLSALCERFKSAWSAGLCPSAEEAAAEAHEAGRAAALARLLELEFAIRCARGDRPGAAELVAGLPSHAAFLLDAVVETFAGGRAGGGGASADALPARLGRYRV